MILQLSMRTRWMWLVLATIAAALGFFVIGTDADETTSNAARSEATPPSKPKVEQPAASARDARPEAKPSAARAKRDALRAEILAAMKARGQAAGPGGSVPERRADDSDNESAPTPGKIKDRIGGRDDLMKALNEDFMPLADECIQQAKQRSPALTGMLAVGLEVVGDADLGAVIESVEISERNEVHEAELLDCIRETTLSTTLPPPPNNGRDEILITMPIEPDAAQ